MLLSEYLTTLAKAVTEYSKTSLIIDSDLTTDFRTEKIGIVKGSITFADESRLFFTEYVDVRYKVEKITYSYHYQDQAGKLIFRYDNARHRPQLTLKDHKHLLNGEATQSEVPEFSAVLEEIMEFLV
jgi:hypothetical protein